MNFSIRIALNEKKSEQSENAICFKTLKRLKSVCFKLEGPF